MALEQQWKANPDKRIMREFEPSINCLNSTGLPKPLARISRVPKHDTTQIIPSDGFNQKDSTMKVDFVEPKSRAAKEKTILKMIHRYNLADLNLSDRTACEPTQTGFKGRVEIVEKPCWQTTS